MFKIFSSKKIYYDKENCIYVLRGNISVTRLGFLAFIALVLSGYYFNGDIATLLKDRNATVIQQIRSQIVLISNKLDSFAVSDNQLRQAVNLPLISREEKKLGYGGTRSAFLPYNSSADSLAEVVSKLLLQVNQQEESYKRIFTKQKSNRDFFSCLPTIKPCDKTMSSGFGMRLHPIYGVVRHHTGVDFPIKIGSPVYATGRGIVEYVGLMGGYGKCIRIDHGYGYKTIYAHLSEQSVRVGQQVERGERIALSGNTGVSLAPHLHYEIVKDGQKVDPLKYLLEAPWPSTRDELVDYAERVGAPMDVIANLKELDPDTHFESIEDIWPDYPTNEDFYYDEDTNS
ncbi:hypothetical protein CHS0354_023768 [Potamilus streckersoni]|uniref:M23ase beta-sheet core domain-containing protein n=1 Tax=Potamilus streckersoni TaxID=2493646 RepID=A0AAE0RZB3_9BIVA|nr:hypothetical protein CHS0354_023768 [Potamilus streckersoni]